MHTLYEKHTIKKAQFRAKYAPLGKMSTAVMKILQFLKC